ncbi:MAG: hypothetical protein LUG89_03430 [Methanosphaera sp.]|nr:hypothetical protein [Methanosphaera sp.]
MTDLIIYYSRSGNSRKIAETIADKVDGKILEIKDKTNRAGAIRYLTGALDSVRNKDTSIEYDAEDLSSYDRVFIGGPVWASKPSPAIKKFIEENDFTNTNVITFTTMMNAGQNPTLDQMNKSITSKGGNIIDSFSIRATDKIEDSTIEAINNLK